MYQSLKGVLQQILKLLVQFSLLKSVPVPSYVPKKQKQKTTPPIIFGRGTRTAVFFVLDNHSVLRRETRTKLLSFDFWIDCRNKLDDSIVGSEATIGSRDFN